jgi:hypothetical protein
MFLSYEKKLDKLHKTASTQGTPDSLEDQPDTILFYHSKPTCQDFPFYLSSMQKSCAERSQSNGMTRQAFPDSAKASSGISQYIALPAQPGS